MPTGGRLSSRLRRVAAGVLCLAVMGAGSATAQLDLVAEAAGECSDLDPAHCLLPFPSDVFTTPDPTTPTRSRVDIPPAAMPTNLVGKPIDPAEWNRNDGWSPGSMLLTFVPDLDLRRTWNIDHPHLDQPSLGLAPEAPIVIIDTVTGQRHPFWSELDEHPETADDERLLIIRPLTNFLHEHRYVVGLRNLRDIRGNEIAAGPAFSAQQERFLEGGADPVLEPLAASGVDASELYLAWDFTIASAENMAGRALAIRDDAFAQLGDSDLADGEVSGRAPEFDIEEVEEVDDPESPSSRIVRGKLTVPNYLTLPQGGPLGALDDAGLQDVASALGLEDALEELLDTLPVPGLPVPAGQMFPGSRLLYENPIAPGPMDKPVHNPLAPTLQADFSCIVPRSASAESPARPLVYGHGLLGSQGEALGGSTNLLREDNFAPCAVDWIGMSNRDILNALLILLDLSNFSWLADRSQQGFLNFSYLARAMVHTEGFAGHPAFQDADGDPLLDISEVVYDGNSQGAIMGGAVAALSPDITKAVLGVPGMNYSTLLHRSVDWEGSLIDELGVGFASIMYTTYPDKQDQLVAMGLIQMLWDRAETNGYALRTTDHPLPNSPANQILLHVAVGDYQVANVSAEVEARTMGARFLQTAIPEGRHWADATGQRLFAHEPFGTDDSGLLSPHRGSALVYFDSGNPVPPSANIPPPDVGEDPHEDPRRDPHGQIQKRHFYETGEIIDVHELRPYCTHMFPRHPEEDYDCDVPVETAFEEGAVAVAEAEVSAEAEPAEEHSAPVDQPSGALPMLPLTGASAVLAGVILLLGGLAIRRLLARQPHEN